MIILLLLALAFVVGGCPFFASSAHTRAHQRTIDNGWTEIHRFTDCHFWNYDWENPNGN